MKCNSCNSEVADESVKCSSCGVFLMTKKEFNEHYIAKHLNEEQPNENSIRIFMAAVTAILGSIFIYLYVFAFATDAMGLTDHAEASEINSHKTVLIAEGFGVDWSNQWASKEKAEKLPGSHNIVTFICIMILSGISFFFLNKLITIEVARKAILGGNANKKWKAMNKGK